MEQQFGDMGMSQENADQVFDEDPEMSFSKTIYLSGIPATMGVEELQPHVERYGQVEHIQATGGRDSNPYLQAWLVTYSTVEEAQLSINGLNGSEMDGYRAKAQPAERRGNRARGQARQGNQGRPTDFPLRLLVQSDMVGAIIGRQGNTIRMITQDTRARVDVHRKDNVGSLEKAITIYGNPENCTEACKRILQVMQHEASSTNKGEISLKILAHNNLIGRIIGKGGNTIKRIMQDTDTKITVSSINDINSFNLERIITVKGDSLDNMARAEAQISAKLRQSYENDLQALAPQSIMFPGLHPMAMMATNSRAPYCGAPPPFAPPLYSPASGPQASGDAQETTYLYIPNNAVGAIIGTKGLHIRNIIRYSGASVKIAPLEQDKPDQQLQERKVTIIGTPEAQWKAQYLIFEKMREEGFLSGTDDVRLTVEIMVASSQVGRIIGKGGQNVRELQRITGSLIKLPEQGAAQMNQDTTVHIIGPFFSVQSAQRRIRSMVQQANAPARSRRTASNSGSPSQQNQQQNQSQQNQQNQQSQQPQQ